jgi:cob(I)alamin adenosyltransferase
MGYRLTRIYTRTGDEGETGLADGSRLAKDAARIRLLGELDELNSHLGLLRVGPIPATLDGCLLDIQHLLFDLGGDLSIPGRDTVLPAHVEWLEGWLDHLNEELPPLKEFILPGGSLAGARCHVARAVARRAERTAVELARSEALAPAALTFLNRLSDFLFVAARVLNRTGGENEVYWQAQRTTGKPPPNPH